MLLTLWNIVELGLLRLVVTHVIVISNLSATVFVASWLLLRNMGELPSLILLILRMIPIMLKFIKDWIEARISCLAIIWL